MSNVFSDFTNKCEQNLSSEEIKTLNDEMEYIISQEEISYSISKNTDISFSVSIDFNSFFDKILNRIRNESSIASKLHLLTLE
jgi:hypothetical protein